MSDITNIIGRITVNSKLVLEVDSIPSVAPGIPAPLGSMAMNDSGVIGRLYVKIGVADTAWDQVDTSIGDDWNLDGNVLTGGALAPNEFFGSTSDHDVVYKRNDAEVCRLINDGLLIGLATAIPSFSTAKLQLATTANGDILRAESGPNNGSGARVIRVSRQYKIQTTDAVEIALASLTIPDTSRVQAVCHIGGRQHGGAGGSVGDGADYIRTFSAKRDGGNAILNGKQTDFTEEDSGTFNADVATDGANAIEIKVTGGATRNMAWSCHMEYMVFTD